MLFRVLFWFLHISIWISPEMIKQVLEWSGELGKQTAWSLDKGLNRFLGDLHSVRFSFLQGFVVRGIDLRGSTLYCWVTKLLFITHFKWFHIARSNQIGFALNQCIIKRNNRYIKGGVDICIRAPTEGSNSVPASLPNLILEHFFYVVFPI